MPGSILDSLLKQDARQTCATKYSTLRNTPCLFIDIKQYFFVKHQCWGLFWMLFLFYTLIVWHGFTMSCLCCKVSYVSWYTVPSNTIGTARPIALLGRNPIKQRTTERGSVRAWKSVTKKNADVWWCQWVAGLMQLLQATDLQLSTKYCTCHTVWSAPFAHLLNGCV